MILSPVLAGVAEGKRWPVRADGDRRSGVVSVDNQCLECDLPILFPKGQLHIMKGMLIRAFLVVFLLAPLVADDLYAASANSAKKAESAGLFGTKEKRSKNFRPFKKWGKAIRRSLEESKSWEYPCEKNKKRKCWEKSWKGFIKKIEKRSPLQQMKIVNRTLNKQRYITDPKNWGVKDYWETPGEFFTRLGDCEDYALAKYFSLKRLGFKEEQLRIVAVKDENLKVGHAILAVYLDGEIFILDNQIKEVVRHSSVHHYKPVYSINQDYWWRHKV